MPSGIITSQSHSYDLVPLTGFYIGQNYKDWDMEFSEYMDVRSSDRSFERVVMDGGLGLATTKPEGSQISLDSMSDAWKYDIYHTVYGTGFAVTKEALDDGMTNQVMKKKSRELAKAMKDTKESVCISVLDNAFSGGPTYGDGVSLVNSAHPCQSGDTNSNVLASSADLSEAMLESMVNQIHGWVNQRGLKIHASPKKLLIHKNKEFEAHRILRAGLRVNTADNDPNALRERNAIPQGFVGLNYLSDQNASFILTDVADGMMLFQRHGVELSSHNDDLSKNMIVLAMERYGYGVGDPLCVIGSDGS